MISADFFKRIATSDDEIADKMLQNAHLNSRNGFQPAELEGDKTPPFPNRYLPTAAEKYVYIVNIMFIALNSVTFSRILL